MLKDPSSNNGVAVIQFEDNQRGMEGYTGDILWNGGNNNGGNWNNVEMMIATAAAGAAVAPTTAKGPTT